MKVVAWIVSVVIGAGLLFVFSSGMKGVVDAHFARPSAASAAAAPPLVSAEALPPGDCEPRTSIYDTLAPNSTGGFTCTMYLRGDPAVYGMTRNQILHKYIDEFCSAATRGGNNPFPVDLHLYLPNGTHYADFWIKAGECP